MKKKLGLAVMFTALAALVLPGAASAASLDEVSGVLVEKTSELDMVWVGVACALVFLMQAGFMFLEIGFSRQKNVGAGVGKILINLGIVTIAWWAIGYGISRGSATRSSATVASSSTSARRSARRSASPGRTDAMLMLYGLAFCAVSLAIVWGTTLERIKFSAYVIYAIVFGAIIYPIVAHSVWGGGFLSDVGGKPVMDFAGSSVVHLTGAVGGLAALLLLGAAAASTPPTAAAGDPRTLDAVRRPRGADPLDRLVRVQRRLDLRHRRPRSSARSC